MQTHAADGEPPKAPTLGQLVLVFFTMGIIGFGGILPFARRILVEERRWMTPLEFNDTLSLCQVLPGPNIINLSVVFGRRSLGTIAAIAAPLALILPPMAIVLTAGALYLKYRDVAPVAGAVDGMAAAAAGLIAATIAKMARPLFTSGVASRLLVIVLAFAGVILLEAPLPVVLLALLPISLALAWRRA